MGDQGGGRSYSLAFVAAFALLMLGTLLYAQFYFAKRADDALCSTLITIVERSSDSIRAHPYYVNHPDQLDAALRDNARTLSDLRNACPE